MKGDDCIFCKLANGDIPTNTIYEDADFRVILEKLRNIGSIAEILMLCFDGNSEDPESRACANCLNLISEQVEDIKEMILQ